MDMQEWVWKQKYQWAPYDQSIEESWRRVARSLAQVEEEKEFWEERFYSILKDFVFLPGGRILANAGTNREATLFNCFVMGTLEDNMESIFEGLKEGALTMQRGGGVGYDFSPLRPKGVLAKKTGRIASGPVSFMRIWNTMCDTILSVGARRGAMMGTLRCDHPDIEEFIEAKSKKGELEHFNLSVLVTDAFMKAVRQDQKWDLVYKGEIFKTVSARELWTKILKNTYEYSEPGVLFIDRINYWNNLSYRETISTTNPCGEIPLPPYGACDLGSFNLTQFVKHPFQSNADFDWERFEKFIPVAVRLLDNVIDVSAFPLPQQKRMAQGSRRIGLGLTGLADTLAFLGLSYGEEKGRKWAQKVVKTLCFKAYEASIELAKEKGPFPFFEKDKYLKSPFIQNLPVELQEKIQESGIRNSHLIAIAPTGTISLLAGNVSSGIEPIFELSYSRKALDSDRNFKEFKVYDYAYRKWLEEHSEEEKLPSVFITAYDLSSLQHIEMQADLQPYVDHSISKTIQVHPKISFEDFCQVYDWAYDKGLKGCTTYRPSQVRGCVVCA
ncbi:MAG: adenosylcobalamin-dependent ribonucleoside-diphosphate reductase [Bdellovibrio sp.]|nr:MAG: adenosylcobalamin-dependent ribonucleoside-diphosphate reductase [Bdellovibrio sp.]